MTSTSRYTAVRTASGGRRGGPRTRSKPPTLPVGTTAQIWRRRTEHPSLGSSVALFIIACTVAAVETLTYGQMLARFGHALSDPIRARLLLALRDAPGYPAQLAELLGTSRQNLSNHLACLRGCGLVVAVPQGRRVRYELADARLAHALGDLLGVVLTVDPTACPDSAEAGCC